ncbi:MAG: hypothetical protein OHK0029_43100 [Armatimonadaceae bacterium]
MRSASDLIWRAEENLRESFRAMARYAIDGAVLEVDHLCMVATGIPNAFFNPVFLYRAPDDIDGLMRRARAFYEARGGMPWTLIISYWDTLEPMVPSSRLLDAGLVRAGTVPILSRDTQRGDGWSRFHPHTVIEPVRDSEGLTDFRDVLAESFGIPAYVTEMLLPDLPPPNMLLYVAYYEGEVVGTICLFDAAGVAGIYSLSVLPAFRRRGIASALVRHALDEACWELGISECVAQASRNALPVFQSLGFDKVALCQRYVEPEHMPPGEAQKRAGQHAVITTRNL